MPVSKSTPDVGSAPVNRVAVDPSIRRSVDPSIRRSVDPSIRRSVDHYKQSGVLLIRNLLPGELLDALRADAEKLNSIDTYGSHPDFYFEPHPSGQGTLLRRVEQVTQYSDAAARTANVGVLGEILEALIGEPGVLFKDKLNLKLPGGSGFKPHVDGHFYWTDATGRERRGWREYASSFINVVIPLDECTRENGCLQVAPLSDTEALFGLDWDEITRKKNDAGPNIHERYNDALHMEYLEMQPGDVAFFDWKCIHGSDDNLSPNSRRILYFTYNPISESFARTRYYEDKATSIGDKAQKSLFTGSAKVKRV